MKIIGWTLDELDTADAATCDWFLAFDALESRRR